MHYNPFAGSRLWCLREHFLDSAGLDNTSEYCLPTYCIERGGERSARSAHCDTPHSLTHRTRRRTDGSPTSNVIMLIRRYHYYNIDEGAAGRRVCWWRALARTGPEQTSRNEMRNLPSAGGIEAITHDSNIIMFMYIVSWYRRPHSRPHTLYICSVSYSSAVHYIYTDESFSLNKPHPNHTRKRCVLRAFPWGCFLFEVETYYIIISQKQNFFCKYK